jgi:hypothetical protein
MAQVEEELKRRRERLGSRASGGLEPDAGQDQDPAGRGERGCRRPAALAWSWDWQWDTQTQFQAPWLSPEEADLLLNAVHQPALIAGAGSVPPRPIRTEDREVLAS